MSTSVFVFTNFCCLLSLYSEKVVIWVWMLNHCEIKYIKEFTRDENEIMLLLTSIRISKNTHIYMQDFQGCAQ